MAAAFSASRTRGQGVGPAYQFVCARCEQARATLGRKRRLWRGRKLYICAECVQTLEADPPARKAA